MGAAASSCSIGEDLLQAICSGEEEARVRKVLKSLEPLPLLSQRGFVVFLLSLWLHCCRNEEGLCDSKDAA